MSQHAMVTTWQGRDIRTLSRDDLIKALETAAGIISEITEMQARRREITAEFSRRWSQPT